jgi:deazaflavin-dependent oxidoreductase (nitroreductase family)
MSRVGRLYARMSPHLAHRPGTAAPTKLHAWLIRRSGGRLGTRFFGGSRLLVLRTTGRKSGQPRESPMIFIRDGGRFVVCASNGASARPPAWWLNLQARPEGDAFVDGTWQPVVARRATTEEADRLWPRLRESYEGFDHYLAVSRRELPVVVLEPRS